MYSLVKHFEKEARESNSIILYFFFTAVQSEKLQRSEFGLYRTLLHQFLSQDPAALSRFRTKYDIRKNTRRKRGDDGEHWHENERYELREFLINEVHEKLAAAWKVFIFVDAIDEAFPDTIPKVIENLHEMDMALRTQENGARMCISCRHFPIIPYRQHHSIIMEHENLTDIQNYIETMFANSNILLFDELTANGTLDRLVKDLVNRSQGLWLWVYNILPDIIKDLFYARVDYDSLITTMEKTPPRLGEIYSEILLQIIAPEDSKHAYRLLKWGVDNAEPWKLIEMGASASFGKDDAAPAHKKDLNIKILEIQVGIFSGGLMEVKTLSPEKLAVFIHPTVRAFLDEDGLQMFIDQFQLQEVEVHVTKGTAGTPHAIDGDKRSSEVDQTLLNSPGSTSPGHESAIMRPSTPVDTAGEPVQFGLTPQYTLYHMLDYVEDENPVK